MQFINYASKTFRKQRRRYKYYSQIDDEIGEACSTHIWDEETLAYKVSLVNSELKKKVSVVCVEYKM
jgi:hypothetical protein